MRVVRACILSRVSADISGGGGRGRSEWAVVVGVVGRCRGVTPILRSRAAWMGGGGGGGNGRGRWALTDMGGMWLMTGGEERVWAGSGGVVLRGRGGGGGESDPASLKYRDIWRRSVELRGPRSCCTAGTTRKESC